MKKREVVLSLIVCVTLLTGVFVSAGLFNFGNNKVTGKAVDKGITWQIEEPTGICMSSRYDIGDLLESNTFLTDPCQRITNRAACDGSVYQCVWNPEPYEFLEQSIEVSEGWNLIYGLMFPGQISSGDISPDNILAGYLLNPYDKNYYMLYPNYSGEYISFNNPEYVGDAFVTGSGIFWIYFNKSGSFKFRTFPVFMEAENLELYKYESDFYNNSLKPSLGLGDPLLVKGWNFVPITLGMFYDLEGVSKNSFDLSSIKGTCNIEKAYLFTTAGETQGEWNQVGLNGAISKDYLLKAVAVKVSDDCILGKIKQGLSCTMTAPLRVNVQGTATVLNNGMIVESKTDYCLSTGNVVQFYDDEDNFSTYNATLAVDYYCSFSEEGNIILKESQRSCGPGGCSNGVCI